MIKQTKVIWKERRNKLAPYGTAFDCPVWRTGFTMLHTTMSKLQLLACAQVNLA